MKKKLMGLVLALTMAFSAVAITACKKPEDDDRTQLNIIAYDGGWGVEWLNTMKSEFETKFADVSFEDGKQGVKITLKTGKDEVTKDKAVQYFTGNKYDLYFTTFGLRDFYLKGYLKDITDIVTETNTLYLEEPLYDRVWDRSVETGTIEDKLSKSTKEFTQYATATANGTLTGKYTGLPMYSSFYNITYDIDLFYERGYYMNEAGGFIAGTEAGNTEEAIDAAKSLGQDGIKGTADDGLPVTYDDFYALCNKMTKDTGRDVIPLAWAGAQDSNQIGYFNNVHAAYEGAETWYANVTGESAKDAQGNYVADRYGNVMTLAEQNGYLTAYQNGRLVALKFAETIINKNYYDAGFIAKENNDGQDSFLMSKYKALVTQNGSQIAMYIDGGWWENEAKPTLEKLPNMYGSSEANRRFGVMTYPRAEDGYYYADEYKRWKDADGNYTVKNGTGDDWRYVNDMVLVNGTPNANVAIRKGASDATTKIAKLFIVYTSTNENLSRYTAMTGSVRPFNYDLQDKHIEEYNTSIYKLQLWDYYSRARANDDFRNVTGEGLFGENNGLMVENGYRMMVTNISVTNAKNQTAQINVSDPLYFFHCYGKNSEAPIKFTAQEYFDAFVDFWVANNGDRWKKKFCSWL